ncbi:MAG: PA14 domain-containing protein, partial [Anaerolineae bacterium]|nr:PA14 domain-containing protein [Anaerolineae bacterium]
RARSNAVWARDAIPDQPLKAEKRSGLGAVAIAGLGLTAVNIGLLVADQYTDSESVEVAAEVSTYAVGVVGVVLGAVEIAQSARLVYTMVNSGMSLSKALSANSAIVGASKTAARVGLVVSLAITLAFFTVGLIEGLQAGANAMQISTLVAQAVAQIIMAVLMFVLSATIIGNIIVGLIVILDTIMSLLGLEEYTSAALLAKALYGYSTIAEPNCAIGGSHRSFAGPGQGLVGGSSMVLTQTFTATATMKDPDDWRAESYLRTLWTDGVLWGSDVRCELDSEAQALPAGSTLWERMVHDHTYRGWSMHRAEAKAIDDVRVELEAGINYTPPISLNMGYEVPVANCWWVGLLIPPICYVTSLDGDSSTDLGALMPMDVLPATVDEFYWWDELGTQQDHDGDGLRAIAVTGNDPDDTRWDADGDGLSDAYELERRSRGGQDGGARPSLLSGDTDGDGLSDADEIRLGTFPNRRDSDGDGVKDGQEVWHYDLNEGAWSGGWQYTYTLTVAPGVTETRSIRVTSDPLAADTDGDGLNDGVEQALGENPRAWTPNPQRLQVEVDDADGIAGPGQTLVYTATLYNQIQMDPGYFITGMMTTTFPSALGGDVVTRAYNLYQGQSAAVVRALPVGDDGSDGQVAITSEARGWMHDGNITDTYRLYPDPTGLLTSTPATAPAFANVAASPGAGELFAVASAEGTGAVNLRPANQVLPPPTNVRGDQGCGPGVHPYAPGIACADDGTCLTTWSNVHYHDEDNTLRLNEISVSYECDGAICAGASEFVLQVNDEQVWSADVNDEGTFKPDTTVQFGDEARVEIWEEDDVGGDDWVGGHTLLHCDVGQFWKRFTDCSCDPPDAVHPQQYYQPCTCTPGEDDGLFWINFEMIPNLWDGVYAAVSDGGAPAQEPQAAAAGPVQGRLSTAVASNGTDFLVVWQQGEPGEQGIYASRVFSDGTPGPAVRLDELGPGDGARPAVAWAGYGRYVVVWQSAATNGIQMAAVDPAGQVVEGSRQPLALSATGAQVAANPVTGQALVVYVQACGLGTCIKGRLVSPAEGGDLTDSIGSEMTIGQPGSGRMLVAPVVAYEPTYGGWAVAWEEAHYWQASYWNNTTLSGPPVLERSEVQLDHDWGGASPDSLINPDHFSARWRREIVVEAGIYHFAVTGDDGIRLLVDEQPVIDDWSVHLAHENQGSRYLSGGLHTVTVEYFENDGSAVAKLRWDPADQSAPVLRYMPLTASGEPLLVKEGRGPQATFDAIRGTTPLGDSLLSQAVACSPETTDYAQCALVASTREQIYLQPLFLEFVPALVGPLTTTVVTSLTIDAVPPTATVTSLVDGQPVAASGTLVIGGEAADATSGVARVQISLNGGPWQDAEGAESWAYAWQVPGTDGPVTLSSRATDLVGNTGPAATITVTIDRTPPDVSLAAGDLVGAAPQAGTWSLSLGGVAGDLHSDVEGVEVLVTPHGNGWQPATIEGEIWRLGYVLSGFQDGVPLLEPNGNYTVQVRAVDAAGNETAAPAVRTVRVDATPPEIMVTYPTTRTAAITGAVSLSGEVVDPGPVAAGPASLEVSFTPAGGSPERWLPATLDTAGRGVAATGWHLPVPGDLEGFFQIDLRAADAVGNSSGEMVRWNPLRGEIDSLAPRAAITATLRGAGQAAQTVYEGWAEDLNLSMEELRFPCEVEAADAQAYDDAWWLAVTGDTRRPYRLAPSCIVNGFQDGPPSLEVCDVYGHCAATSGALLGQPAALASAVLTPAHEAVLTATVPISLAIGAFARDGL